MHRRYASQDAQKPLPEPPLPNSPAPWALFLDLDGTLVELAPTPAGVRLAAPGVARLERLRRLLGGALAVVSGRPVQAIDRILAPATLPAAGVHGAEIRLDERVESRSSAATARLEPVRRAFHAFAERHPGTLVEDKGWTVALHFRGNPEVGDLATRQAQAAARALAPDFQLLEGKLMVEVRPRDVSKGSAVEEFLRTPPFAERVPVYVGDDLTDEDAFRVVNARGGIAVAVDPPAGTAARYQLAGVPAVHAWLDRVIARLEERTAGA